MGAKISIAFENGDDKSVTLFSHWGGKEFADEAKEYVKKLKKEAKEAGSTMPLYRLEPETVMVDFIRETTKQDKRVEHDLYLGKNENDGDNSDYGHFDIEL